MSAPVVITRKGLARGAAEAWRRQYGTDGRGYGSDKVEILSRLKSLGDDPQPDDIDAIVGNGSWTRVPACDGCEMEDAPFVVRVGAEPDYESRTAHLCPKCVEQVAAIAQAQRSAEREPMTHAEQLLAPFAPKDKTT